MMELENVGFTRPACKLRLNMWLPKELVHSSRLGTFLTEIY